MGTFKKICISIFLFSSLLTSAISFSQTPDLSKFIDDSAVNQQNSTPYRSKQSLNEEMESITHGKLFQAIDMYNKGKFMKSPEFIICIMIVAFAVIICGLQVLLFLKGKLNSTQISRLMIITLIIFSLLFLIAAGYSNDQIAPAIGLLGTIAGYLLGRTSPANVSNNKN